MIRRLVAFLIAAVVLIAPLPSVPRSIEPRPRQWRGSYPVT